MNAAAQPPAAAGAGAGGEVGWAAPLPPPSTTALALARPQPQPWGIVRPEGSIKQLLNMVVKKVLDRLGTMRNFDDTHHVVSYDECSEEQRAFIDSLLEEHIGEALLATLRSPMTLPPSARPAWALSLGLNVAEQRILWGNAPTEDEEDEVAGGRGHGGLLEDREEGAVAGAGAGGPAPAPGAVAMDDDEEGIDIDTLTDEEIADYYDLYQAYLESVRAARDYSMTDDRGSRSPPQGGERKRKQGRGRRKQQPRRPQRAPRPQGT